MSAEKSFEDAWRMAEAGGSNAYAVPIRNDDCGNLYVGDPAAARWTFSFPGGFPATPPTWAYLPEWIFATNAVAVEARKIFRMLADLEFWGHECGRCGGQHQIVTRHGNRLVDLPCC